MVMDEKLAARARHFAARVETLALAGGDDDLPCSFCEKPRAEVRWLVAAPSGVRICDECVDYAAQMIDEQRHAQQ
jgi:hypothetical protein